MQSYFDLNKSLVPIHNNGNVPSYFKLQQLPWSGTATIGFNCGIASGSVSVNYTQE